VESRQITQEEVWQIADLLSADRQAAEGLASADTLAEAFGVPVETIEEKLSQIRHTASTRSEVDELRTENARLNAELRNRSPFQYSETERTTYEDGFIETVRSERIRQAAWIPIASFLVFLVIAALMFSTFNRQTERMRNSFPMGGLRDNTIEPRFDNRDGMRRVIEQQKPLRF
jgi:hypothetical protein